MGTSRLGKKFPFRQAVSQIFILTRELLESSCLYSHRLSALRGGEEGRSRSISIHLNMFLLLALPPTSLFCLSLTLLSKVKMTLRPHKGRLIKISQLPDNVRRTDCLFALFSCIRPAFPCKEPLQLVGWLLGPVLLLLN